MASANRESIKPVESVTIADFICFNLMRLSKPAYQVILKYIKKEKRAGREGLVSLFRDKTRSTAEKYLRVLVNAGLIFNEEKYYTMNDKGNIITEGIEKVGYPEGIDCSFLFSDIKKFIVLNRLSFHREPITLDEFFEGNLDFLNRSKIIDILNFLGGKALISIDSTRPLKYYRISPAGMKIIDLFYHIRQNLPSNDFKDEHLYIDCSSKLLWFDFSNIKTWETIWLSNLIYRLRQSFEIARTSISLVDPNKANLQSILTRSHLAHVEKYGSTDTFYSSQEASNFLHDLATLLKPQDKAITKND